MDRTTGMACMYVCQKCIPYAVALVQNVSGELLSSRVQERMKTDPDTKEFVTQIVDILEKRRAEQQAAKEGKPKS